MIYTIQKITPALIKLTSTTNGSTIEIPTDHPRWNAVERYLSEGKLLSISERGTWSGKQDTTGAYKETTRESKPLKVNLTRLDDLNFNDDLFKVMKTGTALDSFISTDSGFLPGTNIMAVGAPGVGKTTVLLETLYKVREADPTKKVLFISAEMNQIDMARYLKRFPHWGTLPILFLSDYDETSKEAIEATLNEGWDLVLTDSYTEVNDTVKEDTGMSRGKTEKWFLGLMTKNNKAENKSKRYTTFITILQMSKGGTFVGSNKLKHMTSAMMHLDWKGGENSSERYMEFSKNRCGDVGKKLFFDFSNGVQFDEVRYKRDLLNLEMIKEEKEKMTSEADAFDRLFNSLPSEAETVDSAESK